MMVTVMVRPGVTVAREVALRVDDARRVGPHGDPLREQARVQQWVLCMDCDGCGWVEGGRTLQTTCRTCGGRGEVRPPVAVEHWGR